MRNYRDDFPNLTYVISPYFHQGWAYDYFWNGEIDWEQVVRQCKAENAKSVTDLAIKDLEAFLSLTLSEVEFDRIVKEEFTPTSGFSPFKSRRKFLERILEILKEPRLEEPPLLRK